MPFKFDKLWDVLDRRGMSREQLRVAIGSSQTTISKMSDNQNVPLSVIDRICTVLGCAADDVMEFVPGDDTNIIRSRPPIEYGNIYYCGLPSLGEDTTTRARQVVVVQATELCKGSLYILVAPVAHTPRAADGPMSIAVQGNAENGLDKNVAVQLGRIQPIKDGLLYKLIGKLSREELDKMRQNLALVFGVE